MLDSWTHFSLILVMGGNNLRCLLYRLEEDNEISELFCLLKKYIFIEMTRTAYNI